MAFFILMIGVFLIIATKEKGVSFFKNRAWDVLHLILFVSTIALYVVNSTFVQLVPDTIISFLSILLVIPMFITFLKRNHTADV